MTAALEKQRAWLAQVEEEIIEPDRSIIDPHHHLWHHAERPYLLVQLWDDTGSGHNIEKTVFVECGSEYRTAGLEHMKCVGETEFVSSIASAAAKDDQGSAQIAGIVAHANLMLGDALDEVLDGHEKAGEGLFRGIRQSGAYDPSPAIRKSHSGPPADLYARDDFRAGLRRLGARGLTFDAWNYHPQIPALADAARAAPETTIVFDHFGGPLGIGPYKGKQQEIFGEWKMDVQDIASCPNVVAKIGGLAMPVNGWGWHTRDTPATSDELVSAHKAYYLHAIDCFGPERCMFESNFPVDRQSVSYAVLWNALKKMAADFSEDEKQAMFYGTAERVYRL